MFYLKYRPRTIEELNNSQVKEIIFNMLQSKNLPHAFLYIGPKGMGKTSTARIFAKSVNCLNNSYAGKSSSVEPCNRCKNCLGIDASSSADVMELDAASNRGIEEVKKLIRESIFAPMTGRYRVFIIDEAHMITHDAFNALLKTIEEPPATVIFILATTNEEKVPITIQSRCLRVHFGSATAADISRMLKRITSKEKITLPQEIHDLILQYSESSFRDAAKLLEELTIQNKLDLDEAKRYLGIRAKQNLLHLMKKSEAGESLAWIDEYIKNGGNVKYLLEDILERLRKQLLIKNGISQENTEDFGFSTKEITQLLKLFTEAYGSLRISPIPAIPLEIAVIEFYNLKQ